MIGADDLSQMQADLLSIRGDNDVSVVFRRGETALTAQTIRLARMGGGGTRLQSSGGQESRGQVVIVGATTLDIQPGDRFTVAGVLYRVVFIRPNRTAATMAEAEMVE